MKGTITGRRVIPDRYEIFENDNNVKSITFTVPKINDGIDLTNLYAFVNLENENFVTNKTLLSKIVNEEEIVLTLNIDNAISLDDGVTKAQISFESADLSIVYSTAIFYIDVKSSVDSYSNTLVSAKALLDLQTNLTKTLDSVNDKIAQALEEAKASFKFAELKIDGVVYDGSEAREIKHSNIKINEFPKAVVSEYEGETDELTLYGTYNYPGMGSAMGNGIDECIVEGVGDLVEDTNSEYYGKYRIRVQNSNGNYFDPVHGNEIYDGNSRIKSILDQGTIYVYSTEIRNLTIDLPLKQIFKRNTYYNLKLKYKSGTMTASNAGPTLSISLLNKTTLEEKKIDIQHLCGENIPMRNSMGERFFTGDTGEICMRVYINNKIGHGASIKGMNFYVVIEESDNPCDGFPHREVTYTDIYLKEPLYKLENVNKQTGELIDVLYDELDLKNARVIRRVRKCYVEYDYVNYDEEASVGYRIFILCHDLNGPPGANFYSSRSGLFRPSIKLKSPSNNYMDEYVKFDESGSTLYFDEDFFGEWEMIIPEMIYFSIIYPLRYPYVENFTPVKIPYRKGLNVFELVNKYSADKVYLKL